MVCGVTIKHIYGSKCFVEPDHYVLTRKQEDRAGPLVDAGVWSHQRTLVAPEVVQDNISWAKRKKILVVISKQRISC